MSVSNLRGKCGACNESDVELTRRHVGEYLDSKGQIPKVTLCQNCHLSHEKDKHYLRDECGIDINAKKKQSGQDQEF